MKEGPVFTEELIKENEELIIRTGRSVSFSFLFILFK